MNKDDLLKHIKENFKFDYSYQGGGYFRKKGFAKGEIAPILHSEQIVSEVKSEIEKLIESFSE